MTAPRQQLTPISSRPSVSTNAPSASSETDHETPSPCSTTAQDIEQGLVKEVKIQANNTIAVKATKDPNLVVFGENDPEDPQQWSTAKKTVVLTITCMGSMVITCCSSIISMASVPIQHEFHVSEEVTTLNVSLFVLGIAVGPVLLGPLSEFCGRRIIYLISIILLFLLNFPVAFANNMPVLLIFRFLSGAGGSAFQANVGGTIADIYAPLDTVVPMAIFTCSCFVGPALGPVVCGFVVQFSDRWQWVMYVMIIWMFVTLVLLFVAAPETLPGIILTRRAQRLRNETGNNALHAAHELGLKDKTPREALADNAQRVVKLLALEPLLVLLCVWTAIQLGITYAFFEIFPIVYSRHGFQDYQIGLAFLSIGVGNFVALLTVPFMKQHLTKLARRNDTGMLTMEDVLQPSMVGCFLVPAGLFIFAFTSYTHVHWIGSMIGATVYSIGAVYNFLSIYSYTAMYWRPVAASAMAANTLVRCSFGAGFPLFARQMTYKLGTAGASSLLAGLNVVLIPIPFLLHRYGAHLRTKSRFIAE